MRTLPVHRYLRVPVVRDIARKMVFIGGPRQVGKTAFALSLLKTPPENETHPAYLNWDLSEHRERLLIGEVPAGNYKARTNIPAFYQTHLGTRDYVHAGTASGFSRITASARNSNCPDPSHPSAASD